MPDFADLYRLSSKARERVVELSPAQARQLVADGAQLIDVRDDVELLRNPPVAGAIHLSRGRLEYLITDAVDGKDEVLIIYCAGGHRGALATASLLDLGYTRVYNLRGGLHAWRDSAGQAWTPSPSTALQYAESSGTSGLLG